MIFLVCLAAFGASVLTFFSGFGLNLILLPVMAALFPVGEAVVMTGVVHFLNNIFKLFLIGRHARWRIALQFGVPAMLAAYIGARLLFMIPNAKQIIAALMLLFAIIEILPRFKKLQFGNRWMFVGGVLSGFFGGLSGHQGALRSMFLIRAGLTKEAFIATGIVIAFGIDVTRLSVYATQISRASVQAQWPLLTAATLSAFAGAVLGNQLLKKMTIDTLQFGVAIMIIILALALGLGII